MKNLSKAKQAIFDELFPHDLSGKRLIDAFKAEEIEYLEYAPWHIMEIDQYTSSLCGQKVISKIPSTLKQVRAVHTFQSEYFEIVDSPYAHFASKIRRVGRPLDNSFQSLEFLKSDPKLDLIEMKEGFFPSAIIVLLCHCILYGGDKSDGLSMSDLMSNTDISMNYERFIRGLQDERMIKTALLGDIDLMVMAFGQGRDKLSEHKFRIACTARRTILDAIENIRSTLMALDEMFSIVPPSQEDTGAGRPENNGKKEIISVAMWLYIILTGKEPASLSSDNSQAKEFARRLFKDMGIDRNDPLKLDADPRTALEEFKGKTGHETIQYALKLHAIFSSRNEPLPIELVFSQSHFYRMPRSPRYISTQEIQRSLYI